MDTLIFLDLMGAQNYRDSPAFRSFTFKFSVALLELCTFLEFHYLYFVVFGEINKLKFKICKCGK
jgi:hypothetical protein